MRATLDGYAIISVLVCTSNEIDIYLKFEESEIEGFSAVQCGDKNKSIKTSFRYTSLKNVLMTSFRQHIKKKREQ